MKMNSIRMAFIATSLVILMNACKKDDAAISLPTLTTIDLTAITVSSAETGGVISSDGGSAVTERGVCYRKTSFPTINDPKTSNGNGSGQFTSNIISLDPGALYFVRAYATNSAGTAYGQQVTLQTVPLAIGDNFGGGKVAYILKPTDPGYSGDYQHGLIAAPSDLPSTNWGAYGLIVATPHGIGSGNANTTAIVATLGAGTYAAKVCLDFIFPTAGNTDWYLPSIAEMSGLYVNRAALGGFSGGDYWTSCSYNDNLAWTYSFGIGSSFAADKLTLNPVRPVRSF